jgi:hypothetical protein
MASIISRNGGVEKLSAKMKKKKLISGENSENGAWRSKARGNMASAK